MLFLFYWWCMVVVIRFFFYLCAVVLFWRCVRCFVALTRALVIFVRVFVSFISHWQAIVCVVCVLVFAFAFVFAFVFVRFFEQHVQRSVVGRSIVVIVMVIWLLFVRSFCQEVGKFVVVDGVKLGFN